MIVTLWQNLLNPRGRRHEVTWAQLVAKLSECPGFAGKNEHPGWSPAEFANDTRALEAVQRVFAVCLDYDKAGTIDAATGRLGAIAGGFLHTTRSHTRESHRFRVVLPLKRPVTPAEYSGIWARLSPAVGAIDQAPKDPSRFWYLPGAQAAPSFRAFPLPGEWLDPDEWLAKPDPTPLPRSPVSRRPRTDIEERARRYIARMDPAIEGSGGDHQTWQVAFILAQGFALGPDETFRILWDDYNPRCVPPWKERPLRHKADGACRAPCAEPGWLIGADLDEPRRQAPPETARYVEATAPQDVPVERVMGDEPVETQPEDVARRYHVSSIRAMAFEVHAACRQGAREIGCPSGNYEIDQIIGGFRPKHITIVGAKTSFGKSSFGIMVADINASLGNRPLMISAEDSQELFGKRLVARRSGLNALRLRDNDCDEEELKKIMKVALQAEDDPFFKDAIGIPVEEIADVIRAVVKEYGCKVVICDYLGRFKTKRNLQDRRNQVTYIAECLSDAIKQSGASGILLSQCKRGEKPGQVLTMEDLKESGDLENMAEHIILGDRKKAGSSYGGEGYWLRTATVHKNKDGPVDMMKVMMPFDEITASFVTVTKEDVERRQRNAGYINPDPGDDVAWDN